MDTFSAIRERRSVKHYDPEHIMPQEDIDLLFDLAIQSPTSFNIQNWRFVVVTDKDVRVKLREAAWDQAQVTDASITIVMCADLKAWGHDPQRYWKDAPQQAQDMIVPMITEFYEKDAQLQRDEAMRSIGLAGQTIMVAAKAMGYDSCPMIGFDEAKVAELIKLPEDHVIGMMVTVGKPLKPAWPKPGQLPLDEVLIRETF